jgi:hypothetical protein
MVVWFSLYYTYLRGSLHMVRQTRRILTRPVGSVETDEKRFVG